MKLLVVSQILHVNNLHILSVFLKNLLSEKFVENRMVYSGDNCIRSVEFADLEIFCLSLK